MLLPSFFLFSLHVGVEKLSESCSPVKDKSSEVLESVSLLVAELCDKIYICCSLSLMSKYTHV